MSIEYPCVYFDDGKCRKDPPEENYVDWCVMGPCSNETPSNADRIRFMSDEELAEFLGKFILACLEKSGYVANLDDTFIPDATDWLKQPAEEVDG